jgi:hypothetical protein
MYRANPANTYPDELFQAAIAGSIQIIAEYQAGDTSVSLEEAVGH